MKLIIITILIITPAKSYANMCFEVAGKEYNIAPELLRAISYVESRHKPDAINNNKNKTYDYGHMQVNSFWKKYLKEDYSMLNNPCYCTKVGAWILKQCIDRYGYNWNAVACYNTGSLKTPEKRKIGQVYIKKVQAALKIKQ